jgi:IS30 family transposase
MSDETIYRSIYVQGRGALRRELAASLRAGRALRADDQRGNQSQTQDKIVISERPPEPADRAVPGHWEGDLLIGKNGTSAIGTLVERSTRFVLLHLARRRDAAATAQAMTEAMRGLPAQLPRSLTPGQDKEQAAHHQISLATDLGIYFSDPDSPWQPGSNENTNGLLRQYFPSVRQGKRQSEAGQHARMETGHRADAASGQGEDQEVVGLGDPTTQVP